MNNQSIITKLIIITVLIFCIESLSAQVRPEVKFGLRYNSEVLIRTSHDNHPLAPEIGLGIGINSKWYTGISANFFSTKSSTTEANHYLLELEVSRKIPVNKIPKLDLGVSIRPGIILVDAYSVQYSSDLELYKTLTLSLNPYIGYTFLENLTAILWTGFTWLPQEASRLSDQQRVGGYIACGLKYCF